MRPAVLLLETDERRRRALSLGLARHGYEVVPAATVSEAVRFARGLGPSVIVAPASAPGFADGSALEAVAVRDRTMRRTVLLLGSAATVDTDALPEDVLFLDVGELDDAEIVRRLRLVLVGRELELEADLELESLVGDLALLPLLELLRALNRMLVSGTLRVAGGELFLERGQVVAARAGRAAGTKAVFRLSRQADGPFRLVLGNPDAVRDIEVDFFELMIEAIEEAQIVIPDERARPRLERLDRHSDELTAQERALLAAVDRCDTVAELLDALPASDGRIAQAVDRLVERGLLRLHKPLAPVAVLTDSTCDLPAELLREHDIEVVPLTVIFGDDRLRDGVDVRARDFYELLEIGDHHPRTEPPPDVELVERYRALARRQAVVSVHISEALSQTVVNARTAARLGAAAQPAGGRGMTVEVVDSRSVSMGVGLLALFAARMAQRGHAASVIAGRLASMRDGVRVFFVVDTLDYLVRGGRLSKTQAAVGKLLGIKPILGIEDGEIRAVDRVRGGRRAHPRIADLLAQSGIAADRPLIVAVAHARAPVWADRLGKILRDRFAIAELIRTDIGPVVGTHAGPGCVGCAAYQPADDEELALIAPLGS